MRYKKGTFCNLHLSWLDPLKVRSIVVVGSKQMVVCDSNLKKIDIYNNSVNISERSKLSNRTYADHLLSYNYGDVVSPFIQNTEPMRLELEDFVECINNNKVPIANGEIGSAVVRVMESMKKSLNSNGVWVEV